MSRSTPPTIERNYKLTPGSVVEAFHKSDARVRLIMGPVGSGKSVACIMEMFWRAAEQRKAPDGIRYSRFAIIRATYPELQTTTLKTFEQWAPMKHGTFKGQAPMTFHMRKGDMDIEFVFLALESEGDVHKLLSLELTGAWINEAREVPPDILAALRARVGRYPQMSMGGPSWHGIVLDTNAPDQQNYLFDLFGKGEPPEGHVLFKQPSGLSPEAENVANLPPTYYTDLIAGQSQDWIDVYVNGEWGYIQDGKPVYPMFRDHWHVAKQPIEPEEGLPIFIGVDFGVVSPAAVFGQRLADGRWMIFDELTPSDISTAELGALLASHVRTRYPGFTVGAIFADPAGTARSQTDGRTNIATLREHTGWKVLPAIGSNSWPMRWEAVAGALNRAPGGRPDFQLSPTCSNLRKGFAGGYKYRTIMRKGGVQYSDAPDKNEYSHAADALQYLLLGGGEADAITQRVKRAERRDTYRRAPNRSPFDYPLFDYNRER